MKTSASNESQPDARKPQEANQRRRLPVRRKILYAIITSAAFFVAVELSLAVIGVKPISYNEDPFVGFTSRSPLFEEIQLPGGETVFSTAINKLDRFNRQVFPAKKKQNDYRIFCVGGSTTYGRPYYDATSFSGWLREYLKAADTGHNWQVINAGGISYASYRVASLMEELIQYEPDLFIIYCGHNEFLERRTYSRMIATPRPIRETAAILGRSRMYTAVRAVFNAFGSSESQSSSEAYELPAEVDPILDHEVVGPDDYQRDDEQRSQTIDHFRFNLIRMIEIARSVGARVVMVNPAANERHMSPFKSQHRDDVKPADVARWEELASQAVAHQESGELEQALSAFDLAAEIDPRFALTHFKRGEVLFALKRYQEAKQAFQRAIDEDVCPLRILSEMQPLVTKVASQHGVEVVDFQEQLESRTETGITGEEWFLDHVHPTIEGHRILALRLFNVLQSQHIVVPGRQWTEEARTQIKTDVLGRIDEKAHGVALRNLSNVMSWARKDVESARLARLAAKMAPNDGMAHFLIGLDFDYQGQLQLARKSYEKSIELQPDFREANYNLGQVYRRLEEWDLATQSFQRTIEIEPDFGPAHFNLGLLYQKAKRLDLAAECFERSVSINAKHPRSWEELGLVRMQQERFDEAIRHLETAIQLQPKSASAHNSLGIAFGQLGQSQKAIASFERALAANPQYEPARQNLARVRKSGQ